MTQRSLYTQAEDLQGRNIIHSALIVQEQHLVDDVY